MGQHTRQPQPHNTNAVVQITQVVKVQWSGTVVGVGQLLVHASQLRLQLDDVITQALGGRVLLLQHLVGQPRRLL
jgi:hypothetical protein